MTRYDRDTAVTRAAEGAFDARIDRAWWIVVGPNGGYLAAIVLHAMESALADPQRAPRSLTLHYVEPAVEGAARVHVRIERSGRSLSNLSARLEQDGRLIALALATFGRSRERVEFQDRAMPGVAAPETLPSWPTGDGGHVPIRERFVARMAIGSLERGTGSHAAIGGWLRLAEPRIPDAAALAMFCDSWPPSIAQRATPDPAAFRGVPTIDLTVHFRAAVPADARADDFYLCLFHSRTARDGYLEEDGEIWSRDGVLLAQSRQLALLV